MNDDRSRSEHAVRTLGDPDTAGERWYERLLTRIGLRHRDSIRHDLEDALAESEQDADFSPQERAMLRNVLGLHRIRVDDVMVPRADIVAVAADINLGDLLNMFRTAGHSRLPVYGETLDDPKGMVHIRDFLDFIAMRADNRSPRRRKAEAGGPSSQTPSLGRVDLSLSIAAAKILRPVLFVPPSMPAVDLLVRMQATRTHMALVIDEYGGTDGLVSIEDLVEVVVGNIEDEHDEDETRMIIRSDGDTYIADARAGLEEVSEVLGVDLGAEGVADEVDTLGGLIVTLVGRVPPRGELIAGPEKLEFEVLDADPRRLKRLRIHRRPTAEAAAAAALASPEVAPAAGVPFQNHQESRPGSAAAE